MPQIWNVLRGYLSFVGPRPERPEFVEELKKQIPHYSMRNLVKPGLSCWAQINFPYGASVEDAMEKLQYVFVLSQKPLSWLGHSHSSQNNNDNSPQRRNINTIFPVACYFS